MSDLPQGELEDPYVLTFIAVEAKEWAKTKCLFELLLGRENSECILHTPIPDISGSLTVQTMESDSLMDLTEQAQDTDQSSPNKKQKTFSEEKIIMGQELSDLEISLAQEVLKTQHPNELNGLRFTLLQDTKLTYIMNNVQIVDCHLRHHWITMTTVNYKPGETVLIYCLLIVIMKQPKSFITFLPLLTHQNHR